MILSEKPRKTNGVLPLTSRPLDLVYFVFFLTHIPASCLVDFQSIYPSWFTPSFARTFLEFYVKISNDPLMGGAMGFFGDETHFIWFKTFVLLEACFQLPVFILGMRGLWRGSRSIYVLLLIYAASTATTTLPCLSVILTTPLTSSVSLQGQASLTSQQRLMLMATYLPYFLIPFIMTLDMGGRVLNLLQQGARGGGAHQKND